MASMHLAKVHILGVIMCIKTHTHTHAHTHTHTHTHTLTLTVAGVLYVYIHSAAGLLSADSDGLSDPYCVVLANKRKVSCQTPNSR